MCFDEYGRGNRNMNALVTIKSPTFMFRWLSCSRVSGVMDLIAYTVNDITENLMSL